MVKDIKKDTPIKFELDFIKINDEEKGDRIIIGYASTFDVNSDDEQVTRQALEEAQLDLQKYSTVLFNHDSDRPIGKILATAVDDKGLLVKIALSKEEDEIWTKVKEGVITKFSIQGRIKEFSITPENSEGKRIFQITKLSLFEVSIVSIPANAEAKTISSYIAHSLRLAEEGSMEMMLVADLKILAGKMTGKDKRILDSAATLIEKICKPEEDEKTEDSIPMFSDKNTKVYSFEEEIENSPIFQFNTFDISAVDLADSGKFKKQLLKKGKWYHSGADNGILEINENTLKKIVKNFKDKVVDHVTVPLTHTNDPSMNTGEVVELELTNDGLDAICEIKEESIVEKIKKGLIKSISASFDPNYFDKKEGKYLGPALLHAALVHEPYIKGMRDFIALSDEFKDRQIIDFEDINSIVVGKLDEMSAKINSLSETIEELKNNGVNKNMNEEKKEETTETVVEPTSTEEKKEETNSEVTMDGGQIASATIKVEDVKKEESVENKDENQPTTETEPAKTEEANVADTTAEQEKVELADAEVVFNKFLKDGKILPVQKESFIKLYTSKKSIQLSDDNTVDVKDMLKKLLELQPRLINFSEEGTSSETPIPGTTPVAPVEAPMPEAAKKMYTEWGFDEAKAKEAWKYAQEINAKEKEAKTTIFN